MSPTSQGSIRLFRFAQITVFLHWSWFIVAWLEIDRRAGNYSSMLWNGFEYLSLFLIVLLHEFGHSLACRQVGGRADQIVLWPLGGVAYVAPPPRPGANLWSIAAGPLVNVLLIPVFMLLELLSASLGWSRSIPDLHHLIGAVTWINFVLLIFNILPIYPLDGGQILRSLLWFVIGRVRSLQIAVIIGFIGCAAGGYMAWRMGSIWIGILAVFMLSNCVSGWKHAQALRELDAAPRHRGFACPSCHQAPVAGPLWRCGQCGAGFDTFDTRGVCPQCANSFATTLCPECGAQHPLAAWSETASRPL